MFREFPGRDIDQWLPIARTGDKSARIVLGGGSGLRSQIVNVFLALMYAEANGYRACLDESVALMRHQTWPSLWNRHFRPVGVNHPLPDPVDLFWVQPTLQFSNQPIISFQPKVTAAGNKRIRRLKLPVGCISCKFRRGDKYVDEPGHPNTCTSMSWMP